MAKYMVYRRTGGTYHVVAQFKTLSEATARADALRHERQARTARNWYYVVGPGLPVPAGLDIRVQQQSAAPVPQSPRSASQSADGLRTRANISAGDSNAGGITGWWHRLLRAFRGEPHSAQHLAQHSEASVIPQHATRSLDQTAVRRPPQSADRPRQSAADSQRQRRSTRQRDFGRPLDDDRVWADEERWDDIALAHRDEEELGIGIAAQWGKGRRSRKGWYIP